MESQLKDNTFVKVKGIYTRLDQTKIIFLEASGDYVRIQTTEDLYVARITMSKIAQLLPGSDFLRIHRSYIVRVASIEAINFQEGSVLVAGRDLPINPTSRKKLYELINILE